jgi:hypothetical protein
MQRRAGSDWKTSCEAISSKREAISRLSAVNWLRRRLQRREDSSRIKIFPCLRSPDGFPADRYPYLGFLYVCEKRGRKSWTRWFRQDLGCVATGLGVMLSATNCTPKADGRHGGVGWEIRVIQGDLLPSQATNPDKFVPIVVTEDAADGMPGFVKSVYCLHWPPSRRNDPALFEDLVRIIYRAQEEAPPLGQPPAYIVMKR